MVHKPFLSVLVGVSALAALQGAPRGAHASDCLNVSFGPSEGADIVFVGTILRAEQVTAPPPDGPRTFEGALADQPRQRITFAIDQPRKGIEEREITLEVTRDGCNFLAPGEEWIVHASRDPREATGYRILALARKADDSAANPAAPPPPRSKGCAGCTAGTTGSSAGTVFLLVLATLAATRRTTRVSVS